MATTRRPWRWWWLLVPPSLFVAWLFAVWPPPTWYRTHFPGNTAFMQMRGTIGRYRPVPLDSIAPAMAVAAMTGEDAKFWEHDGIDYEAIRKALGYRRGDFDWNDARDRAALRKALGHAWERRDALRGAMFHARSNSATSGTISFPSTSARHSAVCFGLASFLSNKNSFGETAGSSSSGNSTRLPA